jgi:hypothetical protein
MTVKIIKTGEIKRVNDSYGARLIEQGQAVAHAEEKSVKPSKASEAK